MSTFIVYCRSLGYKSFFEIKRSRLMRKETFAGNIRKISSVKEHYIIFNFFISEMSHVNFKF